MWSLRIMAGRVINPMIVDGQVAGGVAQKVIGAALYEEVVYDAAGPVVDRQSC